MSHFILLRQRIKVIETIKKTTSAMRLISMSIHSRLRGQKATIEEYSAEIKRLLQETEIQAEFIPPVEGTNIERPIFLLIGSQKGLCGAFNEQLFKLFAQQPVHQSDTVITVGRYAHDYLKRSNFQAYRSFDQFGITNFTEVASELTNLLFTLKHAHIVVLSNRPKTFFIQKPELTELTLDGSSATENSLLLYLKKMRTKTVILQLLYESLLAEQAARFLSMDTAYRNAEDVLNVTKLSYNKARQAAVTRELTELSAGMAALASED
jgi:F-type H+-transporting ATPase subunit gamma